MKPLKLEILFGSKDNLSPALKMMVGSSNAAAKALKTTNAELKRLNDQQKQIDGFKKQKEATENSAKALKEMQDNIKKLRQEMAINPSNALNKEFEKATREAKKLKDAHRQNETQLQSLRNDLNQSGTSTHNLAEQQRNLTRQINTANGSIETQRSRLRNLNQLQQNNSRYRDTTRNAGMAGVAALGAGTAALYAMRKPIDESKHIDIEQNRIAALGLGKNATKEAVDYARAIKTFGTSTLDNMTLVRDGITAFADVHHAKMVTPMLAKMKFANEAMFGQEQGMDNERKFMDMLKVIELRNGLKNEHAFKEQANMIQQVITATGGRVQANEWLDAIKTGGVAVKGLTNEAFYYKMEPIVQEFKGGRFGNSAMSAYQNIYQGRTTKRAANNMERLGLIADTTKLKHDKAGQISYLDVGAIKGAEIFKKDQFQWMEEILLPALAAKGITERGKIHDAIGSIFTNRNASSLFTTMYDQREQIHKNMKLNSGAENIEQLSKRAEGTTAGKELDARAKLHDAYLEFGTTILPIYTQALVMAGNAFQSFTGWMKQNPALANALGVGLLVLAGSLITIGGLLVVFSPLILSLLSLRLMMASLGIQGSALGFVLKLLTSPFKFLGGAVLWLGQMFMAVGRMMLANPIILAITLLATAAYLIYQNWEPIKAFFIDLWASITSGAQSLWSSITTVFAPVGVWFGERINEIKMAFSGGLTGIGALILNWSPIGLFYAAFASVLSWFGVELPSKFTGFGSMIIDGLINGIKSTFPRLKETWNGVADYMPNWLKQRMVIRSPSRVMAGLGGHIVGGIGMGLTDAFPALQEKYNQVLNLFDQRKSPVMDQVSLAAPILGKVQSSPNISPNKQAQIAIAGDTYQITIQTVPGQAISGLERQIEQVILRLQNDKMARARSSLLDQE